MNYYLKNVFGSALAARDLPVPKTLGSGKSFWMHVFGDLFRKHFKPVLRCCNEAESKEASSGWLVFYLQVMDKISASFVFSAAENVSALSARGAVSVAPGSKKQV